MLTVYFTIMHVGCNDDNCVACDDADTCNRCDTGYFLETTGNTCQGTCMRQNTYYLCVV